VGVSMYHCRGVAFAWSIVLYSTLYIRMMQSSCLGALVAMHAEVRSTVMCLAGKRAVQHCNVVVLL
jgi:hypothetical protein